MLRQSSLLYFPVQLMGPVLTGVPGTRIAAGGDAGQGQRIAVADLRAGAGNSHCIACSKPRANAKPE